MQQLRKTWGMLGYVILLAAVAGVFVGIAGLAGSKPWAWLLLVVSLIVGALAGVAVFMVSASRRRDASRDRTQRDPLMEETTAQEKQRYLRRFRRSGSQQPEREAKSRRV